MIELFKKKYFKMILNFLCEKLKEDEDITIFKKNGQIKIRFQGKEYNLKNELDKKEFFTDNISATYGDNSFKV
jgi:hypothetical protein